MGMVLNLSEPALDMVIYGNKSNIVSNYLTQQMQFIKPAFNEFSQRIYDNIQSSYNFINDKLTQYGILTQISNSGGTVLDNQYSELTSFKQIQEANITMQRWVMAHPGVRDMYMQQNMDGYSGSYVPTISNEKDVESYDYRRATDGMIVSSDEGWSYKHHLEELLPGDRDLTHYEKVQISHTHDTIDWILSNCSFDFTVNSETPPKLNRT